MRYIRQIYFLLLLLLGVLPSVAIQVTEADVVAVLGRLDNELARRDEYIDARRLKIDSLKRMLVRRDTPEALRLAVMLEIGDNYSAFNIDSAVFFFQEGYRQARMLRMDSVAVRFAIRGATYLPLKLRILRANELMDSVLRTGIPDGLKGETYDAVRQMSSFIGNLFLSSPELYEVYSEKHHAAQRMLLDVLDPDSERYRLNSGEQYLLKGDYSKAKAVLLGLLDDIDETHPLYARAAHMMADISKAKGDEPGYIYYLALSAISDTRCATLEVTSLQELGRTLYGHNAVERAHDYLSIALKNAVDCNVPLRIIETSQAIPYIESAHRSEIASSTRRIYIFICVLAFLLVVLCVGIMLVRNKNRQLHSMAASLEDANSTKDVYITQFLNLCSIYMDKLNQLNKMVNRKISAGQVDELYKLTKSGKFVEEQSKEFFDVFDDAFLHIYPTFVSDVNSLLLPDKQVVLKDGERLNTDLRILALMRLGIEDTTRIARMLNYSVYTIYTYKNKFKARALDRDGFEEKVMLIKSIS